MSAPKPIKRADYVAQRKARSQTRAFRLFEKVSKMTTAELAEESPESQALMRVRQHFGDDIVKEFTPLALGTAAATPPA